MALWLVRAGKFGEFEEEFFSKNRIYLTWNKIETTSLASLKDWDAVRKFVAETFSGKTPNQIGKTTSQFFAFVVDMKPGDWVVTPRKAPHKGLIAVGEITGAYQHDPKAGGLFQHYRSVRWLNTEVPRSAFDQDLLYSFGAFTTICEVSRNDAEKRVRSMHESGWKAAGGAAGVVRERSSLRAEAPIAEDQRIDLAEAARDEIAKAIERQFKGHAMARLVEVLLQAQGYTTYRSPEGPDRGVDILAAPGPLGFGHPRICVQVKSGDERVDRKTLQQLRGDMQAVQAEQGLLVAWGGYKSSIDREVPTQFFQVRLWEAGDLVEEVLAHYEKLPADIRAELPMKRIWILASTEDE
jgi:restriction system protein